MMWFESVEEEVECTGMRSWRCKSQDPEQWSAILEEAKVHQGLY
jgi:hypothetical protein